MDTRCYVFTEQLGHIMLPAFITLPRINGNKTIIVLKDGGTTSLAH